ncbi:MAG: FHA domain-containing protein [Anaerolineae bacterium]|nr:FHA domain-containing protein [Anaerolineae bacterium]
MPQLTPATGASSRDSSPWRLVLQVSGQGHATLGVELADQVVLGRAFEAEAPGQVVELAPHGAEICGVSRRHARIHQEGEALYVTDLKSTNGTRLNGYRLEPGHGYCLRDGDEVELGKLRIIVRFVRSPRLGRPGADASQTVSPSPDNAVS